MENLKANNKTDFESEGTTKFENLPLYLANMGNESGINFKSVEIKSHSFPVRNARFLAGENIIFEPGDSGENNG